MNVCGRVKKEKESDKKNWKERKETAKVDIGERHEEKKLIWKET